MSFFREIGLLLIKARRLVSSLPFQSTSFSCYYFLNHWFLPKIDFYRSFLLLGLSNINLNITLSTQWETKKDYCSGRSFTEQWLSLSSIFSGKLLTASAGAEASKWWHVPSDTHFSFQRPISILCCSAVGGTPDWRGHACELEFWTMHQFAEWCVSWPPWPSL